MPSRQPLLADTPTRSPGVEDALIFSWMTGVDLISQSRVKQGTYAGSQVTAQVGIEAKKR